MIFPKCDFQTFVLIQCFRDMRTPINVLTGLDYWLDNLMCNVPEVAMCFHIDGIVQVHIGLCLSDFYITSTVTTSNGSHKSTYNILAVFLKIKLRNFEHLIKAFYESVTCFTIISMLSQLCFITFTAI